MATLVFDDFNRPDNPTVLGMANTGQTWSQVSGVWGISSDEALFSWLVASSPGTNIAVIESGQTDGVTSVTLVNPVYPTLPHFGVSVGLICRYVNPSYYFRLVYANFPGEVDLRLQRVYAGSVTTTSIDVSIIPALGDVISVAYCGSLFEVFLNGVSQGTYDDSTSPQNYGTQCGLVSTSGTVFFDYQQTFDDFTVTTNAACSPVTYNCTVDGCVDPGDGSGTYATLEECLNACGAIPVSYNCINGMCIDPGDGSGRFSTLLACQSSGCGNANHTAETEIFDQGEGSSYYAVAQITDSGDELRSKTVKSIRTTGIRTNVSGMVQGYDINQPINVAALEAGTRQKNGTQPQSFADSTSVTQSERKPINVKNAVLWTVRISGDDTGNSQRDRIDEIVCEVAREGCRR